MSLPTSSKLLRCLFRSHDQNADVRRLAARAAQQCVEQIVDRLDQSSETLSDAQLKGYLRAVAAPMIDAAIEETVAQHRRLGRLATEIHTFTLDALERLVLARMESSSVAVRVKAAA